LMFNAQLYIYRVELDRRYLDGIHGCSWGTESLIEVGKLDCRPQPVSNVLLLYNDSGVLITLASLNVPFTLSHSLVLLDQFQQETSNSGFFGCLSRKQARNKPISIFSTFPSA